MKRPVTIAVLLAILALVSSCRSVLVARRTELVRIHLDAASQEAYSLSLSSGKGEETFLQDEEGDYVLRLDCSKFSMTECLGFPVYDADPLKGAEVVIKKGEQPVNRMSLLKLRRLPKDSRGSYVLTVGIGGHRGHPESAD